MKKYIKIAVAFSVALPLLNSCKKFVEVEPRGAFTESAYYSNEAEAFTGLVAAYDLLGFQSNSLITKVNVADAAADDKAADAAKK